MVKDVVVVGSVFSIFVLLLLFTHHLGNKREEVLVYMLKHRYPLYGRDFVYARIAGQGSIYVVLSALEDEGLIHSQLERRLFDEKLQPRRTYELTATGAGVAEKLLELQRKRAA